MLQQNVNTPSKLREYQGMREAHLYDNGNTMRCRKGGQKTAELRSEEVEPDEAESDASGKDQANVWSQGIECEPVNAEAGCSERKYEDKEPRTFPQCAPAPVPAAAPKERAQPPSLTPPVAT